MKSRWETFRISIACLFLFFFSILVVEAASGSTRLNPAVTVQGAVDVQGSLSKGSGTFVIDHPLDPKNKLLYHSFVESPDVKNIYDGVALLNNRGEATIKLPSYFHALNVEYRYLATPIGEPMPNLYLKKEAKRNRFVIAGGVPEGKVSWQITGIRNDPYIRAYPIPVEAEKGTWFIEKGEYLFPEVFAE